MSTNIAKPEATPEAKATTRATGRETATLYSAMTPRLSPPMPLRKTKRLRATNLPLRSLQQSQLWMRSLQQSKLQVWAVRSISRFSFQQNEKPRHRQGQTRAGARASERATEMAKAKANGNGKAPTPTHSRLFKTLLLIPATTMLKLPALPEMRPRLSSSKRQVEQSNALRERISSALRVVATAIF